MNKCWNGDEMWHFLEINKLGGDAYYQFKDAAQIACAEYKLLKEELQLPEEKKQKPEIKTSILQVTFKLLEQLPMGLNNISSSEFKRDFRCSIIEAKAFNTMIQVSQKWFFSFSYH